MSAEAIRIAQDMQKPKPRARMRSFFTVHAAGSKFGLPVDAVQTIFRLQAITPVPLGPPVIAGLVNLRGKIVTAINLARRLGLSGDDPGTAAPLAVAIDCLGETFALLVDAVGDAMECSDDDLIPTPRHVAEERARLTQSYYRIENDILPVLDLDALFDIRSPRRGRADRLHATDAAHTGADR